MGCNCNRDGDVKYTITLNQQGPQGRQGNAGQAGFSPVVDVYSNSGTNYQLRIITKDGEIITPNLKGQADTTQFVTINTNQDIYSQKTFNEPTTFKSNLNMKNDLWMVNKEDSTSSLIQQTVDGLRFAYTGKAMFEYPIETQQVILKDGSYTTPITQSTNHLFIGNSNNTNDVYIRGNTFVKASQNSSELSRVVTQTNLTSSNGISIATYPDGRVEISSIGLTTEAQFDELADDVVDINSQLAGLSFKKYTEEEYESITNPDANTLYMVTNPDGNTFKLYLGSIELEGGGGGGTVIAGGIPVNSPTENQRLSTLNNIGATVTAEPYTA